jgi:hypothetical protein
MGGAQPGLTPGSRLVFGGCTTPINFSAETIVHTSIRAINSATRMGSGSQKEPLLKLETLFLEGVQLESEYLQ